MMNDSYVGPGYDEFDGYDGYDQDCDEAPDTFGFAMRFEHSGAQAGLHTFNAMLMVIMGIFMLMLNYMAYDSKLNAVRTPIGYWRADSTTWMLCAFSLLSGVLFLIHAAGIRTHFLTVTPRGICGATTGKFGSNPRSFRLTWNQIRYVTRCHSSQLKLKTDLGRYMLYLNDNYEAERVIRQMLIEYGRDASRARRRDNGAMRQMKNSRMIR